MQENKIVHFNLFRPENALFKQGKNERAEIQTITCSSSNNCQLLQRGECACRYGLWGGHCPYGKHNKQTGFTRRAGKYYSWCSEQKERYSGIGFLNSPNALGYVGDYVFLPYAHMDMLESIPWEGNFLKKEDFNVDTIIKLITFRPRAMFGGEIKSYQKEVPPQFMKHLSEQMPQLFEQVIAANKNAMERYQEFSNIGRKAVLETITPNIGKLADIHGGLWSWDGEKLTSTNSHASFMPVQKFNRIIIIPEKKQAVKITAENQVNKHTVFID